MPKPPDIPDELFHLLQDARKNSVLIHAYEQRKDAQWVVDSDLKFRVFDDIIQRASRILSGENGDDVEFVKKDGVFDVLAPFKAEATVDQANEESEKLTLIEVASLIETSAKTGTVVLDLQGKLMDQIEWLPLSLGKLIDVTDFDLSENRITALPPTICNLKLLTKLDIHSNQLINLPESFGDLTNLTYVDLHANKLNSLPESIGNLKNVVNLDLSSNKLTSLPDTIGNLNQLTFLNVETNELEEIPYTIGSCTALVEFKLDFNKLKALPEAVGKLECLEILTLHYNKIKSLPTTMGSLNRLRELNVSFNELESIPESLCFAVKLVKLDVGRNFADLRSLPRSIGNLEMLEVLDISSNQIKELPESFKCLMNLRVFHADETPLEVPPRQIVKLGAQEVVQYMADLTAERANVQNNERKRFWSWFCALLRPQCTKGNSKISVVNIPTE